jgi:RNA polymerase sigma factor (sigma-70 family)
VSEQNEFVKLVGRVRSGDGQAAEELIRTYQPQIQRIVRVRLTNPALRRQMDSLDICQSIFNDFFMRVALGQYDLADPKELIRLLARMACNRVIHHAEAQNAIKRGGGRLAPGSFHESQVRDNGESPSQVVAGEELVRRAKAMATPEERRLFELRCEGRSWDEIAELMARTPDAVRVQHNRAMKRIRGQLGLGELDNG